MNRRLYEVAIVDDETSVSSIIAKHLGKTRPDAIHVCGVFYDAATAYQYAENEHIDILICDIRMPDMDGLLLAEKIKVLHPSCEVIFISAYSEFEYAKKAIALGAANYICKPISFPELDKEIDKLIDIFDKRNIGILNSASGNTIEVENLLREFAYNGMATNEFEEKLRLMINIGDESGRILSVMNEERIDNFEKIVQSIFMNVYPETPIYYMAKYNGYVFYLILCDENFDILKVDYELRRLTGSNIEVNTVFRFDMIGQIAECRLFPFTTEYEFIDKAKNYILNHLSDPLRRNDIAAMLYLDASYFSKMFKKCTGKSYRDFLIEARMEKAKQLLIHGRIPIKEIYLRIGYSDRKTFNDAFKKYTGMPPMLFRRLADRKK